MYHLNDLQLALRIAALESLSAAGKEIGMTPAAASAALQRLEKKLGCQLFARSTRRLQLTEEGRIFLDSAKPALALLNTASANLAEHRGELKGEVRLALPSDIGRNLIRTWLDELMDSAPELTVQLYFGDHMTDLIDHNIHLALRYGQLDDSSLKRRQLAMTPRVLVASPEYLAQHGTPSSLNELSQHAVLILNRGGEPWQKWKFNHDGAPVDIEVKGRHFCNDGAVIHDWAVDGRGIAYKSWLDVAQDVTQGRLTLILADKMALPIPLQLVYLQTDYPSHKIRRTIEFLAEKLGQFTSHYPLP
ncbi:LysR family transcriptional regulator [Shewanella colwelliana]|uniref:LysR family transcriptional regulator n=1 Tax=Shewanella colwelliana TaxID=23 RepID=UPI00299D899A|nr:LysR family transcriptional regulator [Shewanella colwelliana]MDX1280676.1 LysR family transcriptional regulator [Shewanella colwelliana]